MPKHIHIRGLDATRLARANRPSVTLLPPEPGEKQLGSTRQFARKTPPRVKEPDSRGNMVVAPEAELQQHKAAFRGVFGDTLSDEFVDLMLTQLTATLAPGPFDTIEASTLNAAIAVIASVKPQTELEALLAVQIVATSFISLKFLKHSQRHLDETFIGVYGGYATRLMRLQLELIRALDNHRRGHKQTVEVRHVHIHPGAQGVVGVINSGKDGLKGGESEK
jgi:hypothetical protein